MINPQEFTLRVQEVEHDLNAKWQLAQEDWRDLAAEQFKTNIMEPYSRNFQQYISGEGISGYGLTELMLQIDKYLNEMSLLSGYAEDVNLAYTEG